MDQDIINTLKTNYEHKTIDLKELVKIKNPNGIKPIDDPIFIPGEEAHYYLSDHDPVIVVKLNGEVRAYPIEVLMHHEVVHDVIQHVPILVTYCPYTDTSYVFRRIIDGNELEFGISGIVRHSNLVLYDFETHSLWQQITGLSVVGDYCGRTLELIPNQVISFKDFYTTYPAGLVLSRHTSMDYPYGTNPYVHYDDLTNHPMFYHGEIDQRLPAMLRVLGIKIGHQATAYPHSLLQNIPILYDHINQMEFVVFYQKGIHSPLDSAILNQGKKIGSACVFSPYIDGIKLSFIKNSQNKIIDLNTNSEWSILGKAISGPLSGASLMPIPHTNTFWFAWSSFYPFTNID